jgi:hypothetical protein
MSTLTTIIVNQHKTHNTKISRMVQHIQATLI